MIKKLIWATAISWAMTMAAQAEAPVSMRVASYQQTVVKDKKGKIKRDKNGKPIMQWVKASKVVPGTIIKYVDTITNDSDQPLMAARVANPIDPNLLFVAGSAASKAKFGVKYSVDGGKHYDDPQNLFVQDKKGKKVQAQPKHYTAIEFIVDEVPAKSQVEVSYKVKLK